MATAEASVSLWDDPDTVGIFMDDQAQRIEHKLDNQGEKLDRLAELLHTELGAAPYRNAQVVDLKKRVEALEKGTVALKKIANQHLGAIRFGKWLIGVLGAGNVAGIAHMLGIW